MNFSTYLRKALDFNNITPNSFAKTLDGTKISRSSFYAYLNGFSVPGFEKAYLIMSKTEIPFTIEELVDVLNNSIPEQPFIEELTGSYRIKYKDLDTFQENLYSRVRETSEGMNDYIRKLIKKDLKERVLKKGEDYE